MLSAENPLAELKTLLQQLDDLPSVVGCLITSHDGQLIVSSLPKEMDSDAMRVSALDLFTTSKHSVLGMGIGHKQLHLSISKVGRGYLVIADFGGGLLVTVTDGRDTDTLIPLMRSITQLVA